MFSFHVSDWAGQLGQLIEHSRAMLPITAGIVGALWCIHLVNKILGYRLNVLGIFPRHFVGLLGIVFSPLLHADFNHLLFNSIPLFILTNLILLQGITPFIHISLSIMLLTGMGVWLFGRRAIHIGASGVIMGYWSYVLVLAILMPSINTIIVGLVCLYYLGSLACNIFPTGRHTSWEAHFIGFLSGIVTAYFYVNWAGLSLMPLKHFI